MKDIKGGSIIPSTRLKQAADRVAVKQGVEVGADKELNQAAYFRSRNTALIGTRTPNGAIVDEVKTHDGQPLQVKRLSFSELLDAGTEEVMQDVLIDALRGALTSRNSKKSR